MQPHFHTAMRLVGVCRRQAYPANLCLESERIFEAEVVLRRFIGLAMNSSTLFA